MHNKPDFNKKFHDHHFGSNKIGIGIVLVLVGFILVIERTGFLPSYIENIIFSWQMLLVAIGFVMTLGTGNRGPGLIVMAVGGFFILPELFNVPFRTYRLFWPAIFIIAGIIVITNSKWFRPESWRSKSQSSSDYIDVTHIFGGGERIVSSDNFRGGKISSIFGGGEIDLTRSSLAPGESFLEIACVFGGVSLIVPSDWNIVIDVTPILGGFSDSRRLISGSAIDSSKTLIIKGAVIFGGGEIKSY